MLKVQPALKELAQSIVDEGKFKRLEIGYPDSGWEPWNAEVRLKGLDELERLPIAALKHVKNLQLAGDEVFDWDQYDLWEYWENDRRKFRLYDRKTNKEIKVKTGEMTDLTRLRNLTGLESLEIYDQELENLKGIDGMLNLNRIALKSCDRLEDISELFSLENIQRLGLFSVPVCSIQGIQNLTGLLELKLHNTKVTDISPLAECDLTEANRQGGLYLEIFGTRVDPEPLRAIEQFSHLEVEGYDPAQYRIKQDESSSEEKQGLLPKLEDLRDKKEEGLLPKLEDLADQTANQEDNEK